MIVTISSRNSGKLLIEVSNLDFSAIHRIGDLVETSCDENQLEDFD